MSEEIELRFETQRRRIEHEQRAPEEKRVELHAHVVLPNCFDELADEFAEVTLGQRRAGIARRVIPALHDGVDIATELLWISRGGRLQQADEVAISLRHVAE